MKRSRHENPFFFSFFLLIKVLLNAVEMGDRIKHDFTLYLNTKNLSITIEKNYLICRLHITSLSQASGIHIRKIILYVHYVDPTCEKDVVWSGHTRSQLHNWWLNLKIPWSLVIKMKRLYWDQTWFYFISKYKKSIHHNWWLNLKMPWSLVIKMRRLYWGQSTILVCNYSLRLNFMSELWDVLVVLEVLKRINIYVNVAFISLYYTKGNCFVADFFIHIFIMLTWYIRSHNDLKKRKSQGSVMIGSFYFLNIKLTCLLYILILWD